MLRILGRIFYVFLKFGNVDGAFWRPPPPGTLPCRNSPVQLGLTDKGVERCGKGRGAIITEKY